jgi:HPt (histidine-containing phosphotransfer) domain-containing protein
MFNNLTLGVSHRFKGSAGNLGAMKLYHHCKSAESNFEAGETQKKEMLTAIKNETKRVENFFAELTGHKM